MQHNRIVSVDIQVSTRTGNLGGEVEFWIEDEKHMITRSCLIFIPGGMKHCPLLLTRVDRPIFHFSTVTSGEYVLKEAK